MVVKTGLVNLLENHLHLLQGRRIGLVSHAAAVLPDLTSNVDALLRAGVQLKTLFGGEHGFYGAVAETAKVEDTTHLASGLPVYSLYNTNKELHEESLSELDLLVFDMQDIGARFYTFLSTLMYTLQGAAKAGIPVIVLDRPNPINGLYLEGPILRPGFESFIGPAAIPVRHGMTYGELALFMNSVQRIRAELTIVPMQGWQRGMWFDQTGLPWAPPSPAMAHLSAATLFPGTCLVEGTNLSEGRGTPQPFEIAGAPWLDALLLAKRLRELVLPGVLIRPLQFQPAATKYAGAMCFGIQLHVTDRQVFEPLFTVANLLSICMEIAAIDFCILTSSWEGARPHLDLLTGSEELRLTLQKRNSLELLKDAWRQEVREFEKVRSEFLLYPA